MGSLQPTKVAIVVTSTRTPRVGPKVGDWVKSVIDEHKSSTAEYELVHVSDYKLPVFDEQILPAMIPKMGQFAHEHSKRWSSKMGEYGGYVFVTPEYNYGIAGSTKNAVDYLYNEILGKPALVVSYGVAGGQAANDALKKTLEGMKLRVAETSPMLPWHGGQGPDLFAAAGQGVLGEDSLKDWNGEKKGDVLKGVEELEVLLKEEVAPKKDRE